MAEGGGRKRKTLPKASPLALEMLEARMVLAGDSPLHNLAQPADVNLDGRVTVHDPFAIVNILRVARSGSIAIVPGMVASGGMMPNVNSDAVIDFADIDRWMALLTHSTATANGPAEGEPPPNLPPLAGNDSYSTRHDVLLAPAASVLANDSDPNNDPLTAVLETGPAHAAAFALQGDGMFSYTPQANWAGSDSFTYHAHDGQASSNSATVTINVANTVPWAFGDNYSGSHDAPLAPPGSVLANDNDFEGDPLTAALATGPGHASSFSLAADGTFNYVPQAGWTGSDSFTYTASDGIAQSSPATVQIQITNFAPTSSLIPAIYRGAQEAEPRVVNLFAYFSDQDDTDAQLAYSVVQNSNPALVVSTPINPTTGDLTLNFAFDTGGIANLSIRATDRAGAFVEQSFSVYVVRVSGHTVELLNESDLWETLPADDPLWKDDELRWTAQIEPATGIMIGQVEWLAKPWDDRDNPAVGWQTFAASSWLMPASGQPGVGIWAITPKVHFGGAFAMLQAPARKVEAEIVSVQWEGVVLSDLDDNLTADNPVELGGGWRVFVGKNHPATDAPEHREVNVLVNVRPAEVGLKVSLRMVDADDPTDADGPIDDDGALAGPTAAQLKDNRSASGFLTGGQTIVTSEVEGANAIARKTISMPLCPGDNLRVIVAGRDFAGALIKPIVSRADPETQGRLFVDNNSNHRRDVGEDVLDEGAPRLAKRNTWQATPLLTVWRRLYVEADSMGAPPEGTVFQSGDDLRGDIEDPDTSLLAAAFRPAFIDVQNAPGGVSTGDTPFLTHFANEEAINDYYLHAVDGVRGTRAEQDFFWTVYIASIYEFTFETGDDNDPDGELALTGITMPGGNVSLLPMEVFRDVAAEHGWTAAQSASAKRVVALHEIGHQFLGNDNAFVHVQTGEPGLRFGDHIMTVPVDADTEGRLHEITPQFIETHIRRIREHGSGTLQHP